MLSHNLDGKVEDIIHYLKSDLGLPDETIRMALISSPDVFGRSLDRIKSHVAGFQNLGMSSIDMRRFLSSFPGALRIHVESEPYSIKIKFLKEELCQDPATVLATHPRYLSYGLARIGARAAFLKV